ncbi:hypothetical protein D3C80_2147600 [compost metagenome]
MRAPVPVAERDAFSPINAGTAMTPESLQLSPRAAPFDETHDDDDGDIDPEQEDKTNGPV